MSEEEYVIGQKVTHATKNDVVARGGQYHETHQKLRDALYPEAAIIAEVELEQAHRSYLRFKQNRGRTASLTPELIEAFVSEVERGAKISLVCEKLGISYRTYSNWVKRATEAEDPDDIYLYFIERIGQAMAELEISIVERILAGNERYWKGLVFILCNHAPSRWSNDPMKLREQLLKGVKGEEDVQNADSRPVVVVNMPDNGKAKVSDDGSAIDIG